LTLNTGSHNSGSCDQPSPLFVCLFVQVFSCGPISTKTRVLTIQWDKQEFVFCDLVYLINVIWLLTYDNDPGHSLSHRQHSSAPKSSKFFKFELDYVTEIYTSANFNFSPLAGLLPRQVKYYGFVTFFLVGWLVILYFSWARAQFRPMDGFSWFMAHMMCFCLRTVLLEVVTISEFISGNTPKTPPKWV